MRERSISLALKKDSLMCPLEVIGGQTLPLLLNTGFSYILGHWQLIFTTIGDVFMTLQQNLAFHK